jgi:1-acyl-sn-glycerol-3-phosphate acyltransferase
VRGVPLRVRDSGRFYHLCRYIVVLILGLPFRVSVRGTENVPLEGPLVVAVSHKSQLDPLFVGIALRREMRYMAKIELFRMPVVGRLVTMLGAFPVDRGAGDRGALERSLAVVADGEALLMFPEGTRHKHDERIYPFLPGVGMIAVRSGAPVIPVAVKGTNRIVDRSRVRFPAVRVSIGHPVDLGGLEGRRSAVYAEAAQRMGAAVSELYEEI